MSIQKISIPLRAFFLTSSLVSWVGLWLTGFSTAHWLLYIAPTAFLVAGISGICPGMIISTKLFGEAEAQNSTWKNCTLGDALHPAAG